MHAWRRRRRRWGVVSNNVATVLLISTQRTSNVPYRKLSLEQIKGSIRNFVDNKKMDQPETWSLRRLVTLELSGERWMLLWTLPLPPRLWCPVAAAAVFCAAIPMPMVIARPRAVAEALGPVVLCEQPRGSPPTPPPRIKNGNPPLSVLLLRIDDGLGDTDDTFGPRPPVDRTW